MKQFWNVAASALAASALIVGTQAAHASDPEIKFEMVRSKGAVGSGCVPDAKASVKVESLGDVEEMFVRVQGLPPDTDFDFFVIQVPDAPFGMSWYQGDIRTDAHGKGSQRFIGRFSVETFMVAPGTAAAPVVFNGPFPDASVNPPTNPIQMYHLGLWFNDPSDAVKVGCPNVVTPFNGEHNAGPQVLNTSNFPPTQGPLFQLKP